MSAVTDPVDRYRHGVLLGNYVEDQFGRELVEKVSLYLFSKRIKRPKSWLRLKSIMIHRIPSTSPIPSFRRNKRLPPTFMRLLPNTKISTRSQKMKHLIIYSIAKKLLLKSLSSETIQRESRA